MSIQPAMLFQALKLTFAMFAAASPAPKEGTAVPFELDRNVILVPVRVSGRGPYLAMIDTGTDPSAIDPALAKELGLKLGATGAIDGGGTESAQASETNLSDVAIGSVQAKNVEALSGASVEAIGKALGKPLRIILGKSFLDHRIVQIDFPGRVIRFPANAPAQEVSPDHAVLRFRYDDDVMLEGVRIDGKPVRAILDTGSNGSVKLTPDAVHHLGLEAQAGTGKSSESTGYRGTYAQREGRLESLDLGSIRVPSPAAVFWSPGTGHDGKPWEANIGNAVLKDFVVTIDAVHGILVLERPR